MITPATMILAPESAPLEVLAPDAIPPPTVCDLAKQEKADSLWAERKRTGCLNDQAQNIDGDEDLGIGGRDQSRVLRSQLTHQATCQGKVWDQRAAREG